MWQQVDWTEVVREENSWRPPLSPLELEQVVVMARLHLYHQGQPCGAMVVRRYLDEQEGVRPLPSRRRIHTILKQYGLTYGRTGWYAGEDLPAGVPATAWVPADQRRHYPWRQDDQQP